MNVADELTRRRFLALGGATAAAGVAGSLLPPSVHQAMAQPARRGGLSAIEHVVVLMQENRSFDHYYGRLRGVRGYGDRQPLRLPDGGSVLSQPDAAAGRVLPFSLREQARREGRPLSDIQYLGDLDHSWEGSTAAWAQGWYDRWVPVKTPPTMTYYDRRDIPLQYELADTFTIADAYHCSVFGSTNPNRNYLWSGTTGFEPGTRERAVTNAAYSYDHPGYDWTTYPERLQAAGVSWRIYQEWDNFTDNAVEYFVPFKRIGSKVLTGVDGAFRTTEEFYFSLFGKPEAEQRRLLAQLRAGRSRLSPSERSLFDRAMYRSWPESLVPRLRRDIADGRLPRVSWLVPSAVDSEHPGASTPVGSATLVYDVLDALASDLETWSKTVLFINFDENDGYFDHVPPPVAPRPSSGEGPDWYDGKPIGLGPRVPLLAVSPWTIGGFVDSEVFDHTSVVRFLERWTGVREPNISAWRRVACGDLTSMFDFERSGRPPTVEQPGPVPSPIERWHPTPPAERELPQQEPGRRAARPLPYRPVVKARIRDDGSMQLDLENAGTASTHFTIYQYIDGGRPPQHLDVAGRQRLRLPTAPKRYHVAVQGPNRFWYELAGDPTGVAAPVSVTVNHGRNDGWRRARLLLSLANDGDRPVTLLLTSLGYVDHQATVRLRPGQRRTVPWPTERGWYDLEVTSPQERAYRRRLTSRVEDGRPGISG